MITDGPIYSYKKKREKYTAPLKKCIEGTVADLLSNPTDPRRPGMLLGRVQAGKTFAFCGIMSLAIDNGFSSVVILTKGTKFLLSQTYKRIRLEFDYFIAEDTMDVMDIMRVEQLSGYQLKKVLCFCVKKEDDNMNKLIKLYRENDSLKNGKTLIIDDEADFCGISFKRNAGIVRVGTIMRQISDFRLLLNEAHYLLVTATPFSLYLQPEGYDEAITGRLAPTRPAFTHLVPKHDRYIGGDHFFNLEGEERDSIFHDIQELVPVSELVNLKTPGIIKLNSNELNERMSVLQDAILNFIVGGSIRRIQQSLLGERKQKYSFVIHTETTKVRHQWQIDIIRCCLKKFVEFYELSIESFEKLILSYYQYFSYTLNKISALDVPSFELVFEEVATAVLNGSVEIVKVNSDSDTESLMDDQSGQLKLSSPFMIFVGGSILDRGISIENLIGFYYGRNPNRFQMDSVLQHLRCFGPRPINDMAVTRMYSSMRIYNVLNSIHQIENALWASIEKNGPNCPVNFIQQQLAEVVPCAPSKVLFSDVLTIRPYKRFLPIGFNTRKKEAQDNITLRVDHILFRLFEKYKSTDRHIIKIHLNEAIQIVESIWDGIRFKEGNFFTLNECKSLLKHLVKQSSNSELNLIVRKDRNIQRLAADGRFIDSPDTGVGKNSERALARARSIDIPCLILLRQNGNLSQGWANAAFYWPVIMAQKNVDTALFAKEK